MDGENREQSLMGWLLVVVSGWSWVCPGRRNPESRKELEGKSSKKEKGWGGSLFPL
jgi:hypothetical protein